MYLFKVRYLVGVSYINNDPSRYRPTGMEPLLMRKNIYRYWMTRKHKGTFIDRQRRRDTSIRSRYLQ